MKNIGDNINEFFFTYEKIIDIETTQAIANLSSQQILKPIISYQECGFIVQVKNEIISKLKLPTYNEVIKYELKEYTSFMGVFYSHNENISLELR